MSPRKKTSPWEKRVKDELAEVKAQYEASKHPLWAWWAYSLARAERRRCPAWVLTYFDRAAHSLLTLPMALPKKRRIDPEIARAVGFSAGARQKKRNPLDLGERDMKIAGHVLVHWMHDDEKLLHAYESAAKECGVSRRTAERAWKTSKDFVTWRMESNHWAVINLRRRVVAKK